MSVFIRMFGVALSVVAGILVYFRYPNLTPDRVGELLTSIVGNSVTIMSIMVAALAILISISGARLVKKMAVTGHFKVLVANISMTAVFFFLCSVVSSTALFLPVSYEQAFLSVSVGVMVFSLQSLCTAGYQLYQTLHHLHGVA